MSEFDCSKKKEVSDVYSRISEEVRQVILRQRGNKLSNTTNLNTFYIGEEAVKYGLADNVDRIHLALGRESIQKDAVLLDKNKFQKWFDRIRKLNISD